MELIVNDLYKLDYLDSLHKLNEVRIGMLNRQLVDADAIIKHQEDVIANNRQIQELQVSLFDISDMSQPVLVDQHSLTPPESWSRNQAL